MLNFSFWNLYLCIGRHGGQFPLGSLSATPNRDSERISVSKYAFTCFPALPPPPEDGEAPTYDISTGYDLIMSAIRKVKWPFQYLLWQPKKLFSFMLPLTAGVVRWDSYTARLFAIDWERPRCPHTNTDPWMEPCLSVLETNWPPVFERRCVYSFVANTVLGINA